MLERAGADSSRPDGLAKEFGLVGGKYRLSEAQAQAILELRLHRLTGLEQDKILSEFKDILAAIADYLDILGNESRLLDVIRNELLEIKEAYADERRTEISNQAVNISREDLIPPQDMVVTLSHEGYVKAQPLDEYRAQRRGGRGKSAAATKDSDFVDQLWVAHSHDTLLCFSSLGQAYWLRVFELPMGSRGSRGRPFVNLLPLDSERGERVNAVLPIKDFTRDDYVFMATRKGVVKKTPLVDYSRPRSTGIIGVNLRDDDELVGVALTTGENDILLFCDGGRAIRFNEADVRTMGRGATGVRGMRLKDGERVISLLVAREGDILTIAEQGYGKRTAVSEYPLRGRGGQGVIAQACNEKTGKLVGAVEVEDGNEIMLISNGGTLIRTKVDEVRSLGRNTQGVRIMKPVKGDRLVGLDRIESGDDEAEDLDPEVSDGGAADAPEATEE